MTRAARRAWLVLLALAVALACAAPAERVRVLLITLDTLRSDRLDGDADTPSVMPHTLDRAREGARFTRFYAAAPETQPAHASMFTGLAPWEHGVTRNGRTLEDDALTLAEILNSQGFETRAVVASFPVAARFGFAQGFDAYDDDFAEDFFGVGRWGGAEVPESGFFSVAERITERAIAALDASSGDRLFYWFHYFDPHSPYGGIAGGNINRKQVLAAVANGAPAEKVLERVHRLYDADVAYLDRALERLFRRLDADADRYETHVLVVADHGEALGEEGSIGHGFQLTDEVLRVPAFILSPRVARGERRDVAGSADVMKTVLSLAGVDPDEVRGRDLTRPAPEAGTAEAVGMRPPPRKSPLREERLDGTTLEHPPVTFFVVDPEGRLHLGSSAVVSSSTGEPDAEARARMLERFARYEAGLALLAQSGGLDPETEAGLRALGYLE